jgi:hypothetical protein
MRKCEKAPLVIFSWRWMVKNGGMVLKKGDRRWSVLLCGRRGTEWSLGVNV